MKTFTKPLDKTLNTSGVYLIKIHDSLYVGSSACVKQRLQSHIRKLKKINHENRFMQNKFNKYGLKSCSYCLLEKCYENIRLHVEKCWIDKLNPNMNSKMDPITQTNSITQSKIVYQYDLNGNYIGYFPSASEAGRHLSIESSSIASCCRKSKYKSAGGFVWSYVKESSNYTNNSSKSKIRSVTMFTKLGLKIKTFNSIIDAAKYISDNDNLESLSASISAAASNTSTSIKDRFIFSYEEKPIIYTGTKNFPTLQEKPNGEKVLWNSTKEAANALDVKTLYIMRVINGERKSFKGCKWSDARLKQGELLGSLSV